jgi:3-oxoacyl-[acyl-carrier protein] reductase
MDTGLAGKVALITGGAGAIGRACALALAAERAHVAIADLSLPRIEPVLGEVRDRGVRATAVAVDVTSQADVSAMVERVVADLGGLDILVNCVGIFQATPVDELALADWQRVLDVNLTGIFLCCQAAMRVLTAQRSGRIINIASLAGEVGGLAAGANYSVSKAGVMCLTKSLARALGRHGVTVNTINPGPVESAMVDAWPPGQRERQLANIPLGRLGTPDDIAGAVVFLASAAASYIHGTHLDINGGLFMC